MKNQELDLLKLSEECRKYIKCDTARISKPSDKMFLIIGFNKNTKDDHSTITINGKNEIINYDYIQEEVVASGKDEKELIESVKDYTRICSMSMEEYLNEIIYGKQ